MKTTGLPHQSKKLVGYRDSPKTPLGKLLASVVMIIGYAVIAVPTGIVAELTAMHRGGASRQSCPACGREGHDEDATHCKYCGAGLGERGNRAIAHLRRC